ncbi:hypothetical protein L484_011365 [Morus notabilis]|uniref:Uncharacterized protein n=1 Tax=Morus notabilis TaxID=981085 RepID=W9S8B6_9ROSA|nr:hypothetical protein L484_011365 [Morus notabilis]
MAIDQGIPVQSYEGKVLLGLTLSSANIKTSEFEATTSTEGETSKQPQVSAIDSSLLKRLIQKVDVQTASFEKKQKRRCQISKAAS